MILNDAHSYLIAMWKGLQDGSFDPPEIVTKEDYYRIKSEANDNPALAGFVGFQCSFSGKWWGGYAKGENRNYAKEGRRSALKRIAQMKENTSSLQFTCKDYKDVELPEGCVIYADPPYAGTTGYGGKFDTKEFWNFAERVSQEHRMYISEQSAPPNFVPIWEQTVTRTVDHRNNNYFKATEKLFLHQKWI